MIAQHPKLASRELVRDPRNLVRAKSKRLSTSDWKPCPRYPGTRNGLQTFLDDGRVEIDSNGVENLIRQIALNRKNALFAGHDEGGKAWGRIASLIETAKINDVEPFDYLKATLEAIADGHPQNRIDDLLPLNFPPST